MSLGEVLERIADDVVATQPPLDREMGLLVTVAAAMVVVVPGTWSVARHLLTIVHEGGHAAAALVSGRRLAGIRLHADTSGLTVSKGRSRGPGMVATAFAGYPAPAVVGLGVAFLVSLERDLLALWAGLLVLSLLLLQIRNFYGLYIMLVAAVLLVGVTWWGSPEVQGVAAWGLASFLLLGAPRAVVELQVARRRSRGRTSDADVLARITPLPATVWVGVMLLLTVGCAAAGALLLLRG
ncbi:MAG: M50 family metallopeptidase [Actinomycetota bacterium]|nr:M50 family metallopeptidase [Actinomycetota bacterium]